MKDNLSVSSPQEFQVPLPALSLSINYIGYFENTEFNNLLIEENEGKMLQRNKISIPPPPKSKPPPPPESEIPENAIKYPERKKSKIILHLLK